MNISITFHIHYNTTYDSIEALAVKLSISSATYAFTLIRKLMPLDNFHEPISKTKQKM